MNRRLVPLLLLFYIFINNILSSIVVNNRQWIDVNDSPHALALSINDDDNSIAIATSRRISIYSLIDDQLLSSIDIPNNGGVIVDHQLPPLHLQLDQHRLLLCDRSMCYLSLSPTNATDRTWQQSFLYSHKDDDDDDEDNRSPMALAVSPVYNGHLSNNI